MTSPFSADEQTTAEMAAEQLVTIERRQRRQLATAHWGARLAMTAVIVWAFGQPDAVDLGPLVFSLAAVGGTAVIGNRRLLEAGPGPVVRIWSATALLGILAIAGWANDWPVAARVQLAGSCLLATDDGGVFNCAGWSGWRSGDRFKIRGQRSWIEHHDKGGPPLEPNGSSFTRTEAAALWGGWYLVEDLTFVDAGYWF